MTDRQALKPLDADLKRALASERSRPGPSARVRARAVARMQAALGVSGGGEGGADSSPSPDMAAPDLTSSAPESGASLAAVFWAHPALTGGAGFLLGGLVGAALHAAIVVPPSLPPGAPLAVVPASSVLTVVAVPAPSAPLPAASQQAPVASATALVPTAPSAGSTLTAERTLLDVARAAIARGEPAAATDALKQHQGRFSRGVFREEREALFVQALRDMGRIDEARRRAQAFRARYPNSLFLSTVERVLEAKP